MLSVIQKQIRKAAIEGNLAMFTKLLDKYNAIVCAQNLPKNQTASTFIENGSVLASIIETPCFNQDMHKIVVKILDEHKQHGFELYDGFLSIPAWDDISQMKEVNGQKVYEWAIQSNAVEVLDHPLVQQEMLRDQIRSLVLGNELEQAQVLARHQGISREFIYSHKFIEELAQRFNNTPGALDVILSSLLNDKALSVTDLNKIPPYSPAMAAHIDESNYPKTVKTQAVKLVKAIATLEKETKDGEQQLVALRLMDEYFNGVAATDISSLSTALLTVAIEAWNMPTADASKADSISSEKEQIILALLDKYQAEISMVWGIPGNPNLHLSYMIDNNMVKALAHPTVVALFDRLCAPEQKELLEKAGKYGTNPTVPSEKDLSMVQTLVGHVKKQTFNPAYPMTSLKPITLESLAGNLNTLSTVPHKAKAHQRWLQIFGLLLENGLVDDVDTLKKGSHTLKLQDHNRGNATYDLRKYVKDNPVLFTAFSKVATKEQLEKMKKENTVQVTPTVQAAPAQAVTAITPANPAAITATAITPSFAAHAQAQPLNAQYDSIKETLNDFLKKSKGVMTKY